MDWGSIAGGAANTFGKGMSLSHEQGRNVPGFGNVKSPVMDEFGNFYRLQDEYEDNRQVSQQQRLNALMIQQERASFEQKMAMAREQGLHPLSVLGVNMSGTTIGASLGENPMGAGGVSFGDTKRHEAPQLSEHDQKMMDYNERIASANARSAEADAARNELTLMRQSSVATGRPGSVSNDVQVRRQSSLSGVPASSIKMGGSKSFAGSGDTALIEIKPDEITASSPANAGLAAGVAPGFRMIVGPDEKKMLVPDQSVIQTEIDEGALYNSLINHGVSPGAALDIVGLKDIILGGLAGVGGVGAWAWKSRKAAQAAELARKAKAHRRWKGGE